jgi:hypothetical protein
MFFMAISSMLSEENIYRLVNFYFLSFEMMSTSGLQAKIGKEPELKAALQRLRGKNADISQEAADIRVSFRYYVLMTVCFLLT